MMKKIKQKSVFVFIIVLSIINSTVAQEKPFTKGIYKTYLDFKNKIPSDTITKFKIKTGKDTLSHRFYRVDNNKRLKKYFAFYNETGLYLSLKKMIKLFPREDRSQLKDDGNYHIKAIQNGKRYLYFEDYFTSKAAALFGGIIGGSAARRLKPIIYDKEKKVFNLFKNAEDFETFIKKEHPSYLEQLTPELDALKKKRKRKKKIEDRVLIRKIIFEINKE